MNDQKHSAGANRAQTEHEPCEVGDEGCFDPLIDEGGKTLAVGSGKEGDMEDTCDPPSGRTIPSIKLEEQ